MYLKGQSRKIKLCFQGSTSINIFGNFLFRNGSVRWKICRNDIPSGDVQIQRHRTAPLSQSLPQIIITSESNAPPMYPLQIVSRGVSLAAYSPTLRGLRGYGSMGSQRHGTQYRVFCNCTLLGMFLLAVRISLTWRWTGIPFLLDRLNQRNSTPQMHSYCSGEIPLGLLTYRHKVSINILLKFTFENFVAKYCVMPGLDCPFKLSFFLRDSGIISGIDKLASQVLRLCTYCT